MQVERDVDSTHK